MSRYLLLLLLFPLGLLADFDQWVESQMAEFKIVGASVAVIDGGRIAWARGYGRADRELEVPVTPRTRFQAGSISKPVAALGALIAFAQAGLPVDTDVNSVLCSWQVPGNQPVSLQQLLEHSAGTTGSWYPGYSPSEPLPKPVEVLQKVEVVRPPGQDYVYSGGGYMVVQQVLVDLYCRPFSSEMHRLVLHPLHMRRSTFRQGSCPGDARPYLSDGKPLEGGPRQFVAQACCGLWTTPSDLCCFAMAIQGSWPTCEIATQMLAPTITPHRSMGFEVNLNKYGEKVPEGDYFMHGGFNNGYLALLIASRTANVGAVIMINTSPSMGVDEIPEWSFLQRVLRRIANTRKWP